MINKIFFIKKYLELNLNLEKTYNDIKYNVNDYENMVITSLKTTFENKNLTWYNNSIIIYRTFNLAPLNPFIFEDYLVLLDGGEILNVFHVRTLSTILEFERALLFSYKGLTGCGESISQQIDVKIENDLIKSINPINIFMNDSGGYSEEKVLQDYLYVLRNGFINNLSRISYEASIKIRSNDFYRLYSFLKTQNNEQIKLTII